MLTLGAKESVLVLQSCQVRFLLSGASPRVHPEGYFCSFLFQSAALQRSVLCKGSLTGEVNFFLKLGWGMCVAIVLSFYPPFSPCWEPQELAANSIQGCISHRRSLEQTNMTGAPDFTLFYICMWTCAVCLFATENSKFSH